MGVAAQEIDFAQGVADTAEFTDARVRAEPGDPRRVPAGPWRQRAHACLSRVL